MENSSWWESSGGDEVCIFPRTSTTSTTNIDPLSDQNQKSLSKMLSRMFLPAGYPQSVRPEYLEYQYWDSLQGVCSYLRMVLCTRSVFEGAGVGNSAATPLAAAMSWVMKDGFSILGTLIFTYHFSSVFENNVKEWRFLADGFNNIGLTLDMLIGYFGPRYFLVNTSISTLFKSLCGLIAGATKARIATHFARDGHLADVISKESTQETAVTLVGLVLGMVLSQALSADRLTTWSLFIFLSVLHQWANYKLVSVLVLETVTTQSLYLLTKKDLLDGADVPSSKELGPEEHLWFPILHYFYGPRFGVSLNEILQGLSAVSSSTNWTSVVENCWGKGISNHCVYGLSQTGRLCLCLPKSVDAADDDHAKITSHLIGFYAFFKLEECVKCEKSLPTLARRYELLVSEVGPQVSKALPRLVALATRMQKKGWDMAKGHSRLGEGAFRYSYDSRAPLSSTKIPSGSTSRRRSRNRSRSRSRTAN